MVRNINTEIEKCLDAEVDAFAGRSRPAYENIIICLYELGSVARHTIYSGRKIEDIENVARAADVCNELADVITQALIMFRKYGKFTGEFAEMSAVDFINSGLERQQHRMAELIGKGRVNLLQDKGLFTEA